MTEATATASGKNIAVVLSVTSTLRVSVAKKSMR